MARRLKKQPVNPYLPENTNDSMMRTTLILGAMGAVVWWYLASQRK